MHLGVLHCVDLSYQTLVVVLQTFEAVGAFVCFLSEFVNSVLQL